MNDSKNAAADTLDTATMRSFDHLLINASIATFSAQYGFNNYAQQDTNHTPYGQLTDTAIGIKDGKIAWVGTHQQIS